MKKCPFCAEEIQDLAIKCRFCNEFLDRPSKPQKAEWYFSTPAVVIALLSVGPLALPLVWFHPLYRRMTKIILTMVIVGVTIWTFFLTRDLFLYLVQQLKILGLY